jgi:hypothetical protein
MNFAIQYHYMHTKVHEYFFGLSKAIKEDSQTRGATAGDIAFVLSEAGG